jgi:tetratricopeptide (TPR) repeat protein
VVAVLWLGGAAGLLAGCGGSKQIYRSAPLEREIELNRKATTAFERGQYETALAGYSEALRISRAIEHVDGIAANLLDLAAVHRVLGDPERAALALDELLSAGKLAFSPAQRSSAAYLRALLFADQNALADASRLATQARALCRESECGNEGRIVNLEARIAFLAGDRAAALAAALEALALNRESKADEETANSLRIAADVHSVRGELAKAQEGYAAALVLDKKLGLAAKIRLDLLRLGDVAAGQGRGEDARVYYRRALDASRGAADEPGTAEAVERIRGLGETR